MEVSGLRELINALEQTDKAAVRVIDKRIRKAGNEVAKAAQRRVFGYPLSGWGKWIESTRGRDLSFEPSNVIRGIRLQKNNFRYRGVSHGVGFDVWNKTPGGAIFEVIGDESRVGQTDFNWQGQGFVRRIKARFPGTSPRILLPSYYEGMPQNLKDEMRDQILSEARKAGLI